MKEYIDSVCRSCFHSYVCEQFNEHRDSNNEKCHFHADHFVNAADVVSKAAFDQVAWERDVAIQQLREDYGVGLGEKKPSDVVERKHGRWTENHHVDFDDFVGCDVHWYTYACSECGGEVMNNYSFCPNCGSQNGGYDE